MGHFMAICPFPVSEHTKKYQISYRIHRKLPRKKLQSTEEYRGLAGLLFRDVRGMLYESVEKSGFTIQKTSKYWYIIEGVHPVDGDAFACHVEIELKNLSETISLRKLISLVLTERKKFGRDLRGGRYE